MNKQKNSSDSDRFIPTEEDISESRRVIENIQKETRFLTRADFELVLKAATKPVKKESGEKEPAKT